MDKALKLTVREYQRNWRRANPNKCKAYTNKYRSKRPETGRKSGAKWYKKAGVETKRIWRSKNRGKVLAATKRWQERNPGRRREYHNKWCRNNRERVNASTRKHLATHPSAKVAKNMRARIRNALMAVSVRKTEKAYALLGCNISFLRGHLEAQFKPGMQWSNYGLVWEVDHRIPCSAYDLTDVTQQVSCFHYRNLQPLFVSENRRKNDKVPAGAIFANQTWTKSEI